MNFGSIVLIGNGIGPKGKGLGKNIDAFDTVIRFSHFQTKGHEEDLGTRTDIWIGYQKPHACIPKCKLVVFNWIGNCDIMHMFDAVIYACTRAGVDYVRMPQVYVDAAYDELGLNRGENPKPTNGFVGIVYALAQAKKVSIAGFDGYTLGHHFTDPSHVPENCHIKHKPHLEQKAIKEWIKEGRITVLDQ